VRPLVSTIDILAPGNLDMHQERTDKAGVSGKKCGLPRHGSTRGYGYARFSWFSAVQRFSMRDILRVETRHTAEFLD
jgi:hypothetical protein